MVYIRQDAFSVGEVDEVNYLETQSPFYLKALKKAENFLINDTGKAVKRTGFRNINTLSNEAIGPDLTDQSRMFPFFAKEGGHYIIIATDLKFHFYSIFDDMFKTPIDTPYTNDQLNDLDFTTTTNNVVLFVHSEHIPARLTEAIGVFTYTPLNFAILPAYDLNTVDYNSSTAVLSGGTTAEFTLTVDGSLSFTTAWVGGVVIGEFGNSIEEPNGYGIITEVTPGATTIFKGTVKIDFKDGNYKGRDFSIRQPVFTPALGFPSVVTFFQNRIFYANTITLKNTIFGTQINKFDNLDVGVGRDTDAIIYTIGYKDAGEITHLNSGKQLEIFTLNHEYVVPQPDGQAVTPSNFSAPRQSSYGTDPTFKPLTYENNSYFLGRGGTSLFRFKFEGIGRDYSSENVSVLAEHLIKNPNRGVLLQSTTFAQENYLFMHNPTDASLTAYQFSDVARINAFTDITFGTQFEVQPHDLANVNNDLYMLVELTLQSSQKRLLAKYVENDVHHDMYIDVTVPENGIVTGLSDYEGYTVSVLLLGGIEYLGDYLVTGGQITIDNPGFPRAGDGTVGITYNCALTPLSLLAGEKSTDALKKSSYVYVDYFQSLDFKINGKIVPFQTFEQIQSGVPLLPTSGRARIGTSKGWGLSEDLFITQTTPLFLTILAIAYQIEGELI